MAHRSTGGIGGTPFDVSGVPGQDRAMQLLRDVEDGASGVASTTPVLVAERLAVLALKDEG
jgi:hypothetical protein